MIPRYTKMINRRSFAKDGVQLNYIATHVRVYNKKRAVLRGGAWSLLKTCSKKANQLILQTYWYTKVVHACIFQPCSSPHGGCTRPIYSSSSFFSFFSFFTSSSSSSSFALPLPLPSPFFVSSFFTFTSSFFTFPFVSFVSFFSFVSPVASPSLLVEGNRTI